MQSTFFIALSQLSCVMFFGMSRRAAEILRRRNLHHRVPVDRRIIVRRRRLVRRRHRREIELLAGLAAHLRRIDQPVAAHPDLVVGVRKVGDDVAALVVGDDDLGVAGRQIGGLRDHPDAGLRSVRAGDHAADVVVVDGDGGLRPQLAPARPRAPRRGRSPPRSNTACSCSLIRALLVLLIGGALCVGDCARPTPARWARLCIGRCRSATMPRLKWRRPAGAPP